MREDPVEGQKSTLIGDRSKLRLETLESLEILCHQLVSFAQDRRRRLSRHTPSRASRYHTRPLGVLTPAGAGLPDLVPSGGHGRDTQGE